MPSHRKGSYSVIIDLKRFFQSDGFSEKLTHTMDMSGMELGGVKPFCAPVEAGVSLTSFGGSVVLEAQVEFSLTMPCDRCFETVTRDYAYRFTHTLVRELASEEDDGELILVEDGRLDLDGLLQEDILLELPAKFLCREDCEGLCPKCGKNLNEGPCGCERREIDPRLEALKAFLVPEED